MPVELFLTSHSPISFSKQNISYVINIIINTVFKTYITFLLVLSKGSNVIYLKFVKKRSYGLVIMKEQI